MSKQHPVLTEALRLESFGVAVHWLKKRSKAPLNSAWQKAPVPTAEDLEDTFRKGYNVGVRLGEYSEVDGLYLHVLDLDVRKDEYIEDAKDALLDLVGNLKGFAVVQSGSGGASRHFYFLTDKPFRSKKLIHSEESYKDHEGKKHWVWEIELFGTGKQVAAPPSIHPDTGNPYKWLVDLDPEKVRDIPSETVAEWTGRAPDKSYENNDLGYVVGRLGWKPKKLWKVLKNLDHDEFCEDRDGWLRVGMALHHETGGSDEGLELWHVFSEKSGKYDPDYLDKRWPGFGQSGGRPVRFVSLVKDAGMEDMLRETPDEDEDVPTHVLARPYSRFPDPQDIPRREWLYERSFIRETLSVTVAPGGVGKSSLLLAEAVAMASGQATVGEAPKERLRVWVWNLEDPEDELARRLAAILLQYDIERGDVEGNLFVNGAEEQLVVATEDKGGVTLYEPLIGAVIAEMNRLRIDVLIVDPFVSSHTVSENSNNAIAAVSDVWRKIARETGAAVHLVHHVRKGGPGQSEFSADDARGAKALTDAARSVRVLNRMSKQDAEKYYINNPWAYVRVDDGKSNFAPPSDVATWRHIASVTLPNMSEDMTEPGDSVGVVTPWTPAVQAAAEFHEKDRVLAVMADLEWREDVRAENWIGKAVAEAIGLNLEDAEDKKSAKRIVASGVSEGWLRVERRQDQQRKVRAFILPGEANKVRAKDLL